MTINSVPIPFSLFTIICIVNSKWHLKTFFICAFNLPMNKSKFSYGCSGPQRQSFPYLSIIKNGIITLGDEELIPFSESMKQQVLLLTYYSTLVSF